MASFSRKRISQITGLTPRQVQFYTEEGIVTPEEGSGKGRGSVRKYSEVHLCQFLLLKELVDFGMTVQKIKDISNLLNLGRDYTTLIANLNEPAGQKKERFLHIYKGEEGKFGTDVTDYKDVEPINFDKMREYPSCITINLTKLIRMASKVSYFSDYEEDLIDFQKETKRWRRIYKNDQAEYIKKIKRHTHFWSQDKWKQLISDDDPLIKPIQERVHELMSKRLAEDLREEYGSLNEEEQSK